IDIAELAIKLLHLLDALAQLGGREDVALVHLENVFLQEVRGAEQLHTDEIHLVQVNQLAFFNWNIDVGALARLVGLEQGNSKSFSAGIAQRDLMIQYPDGEIAL